MTGFSAAWLDLREPYDLRARNPAVLSALAAAVADRPSIAIVDIACGTGATLRAISSRLPRWQSWRVVDNDLDLLARAAASESAARRDVAAVAIDIARDLEAALSEPLDLVTASALLDLVSANWLALLAREIARRGLWIYAALTYDGRIAFEPADRFDDEIVSAVNRHQRLDKGFGPALGPTAALEALASFKALGYVVAEGKSDWTFGPPDCAIQVELIGGWAAAARESGDLATADIDGWLARRRELISAGRSSSSVGHVDFFARPIGERRADKSQSNNTSPSSG